MAAVTNNSLTMADLSDHAYFLADEQVGVVFDAADVMRLLNMGIRRVLGATFYPYDTVNSTVAIGKREYALLNAARNNVSEKADIEWVDLYDETGTVLLAELTRSAFVRNDTAVGQPTEYAAVGNSIILSPVPDAAYSIKVSYRAELPVLVATDYPPLSDEQIECVAFYAVWQMKLKDDEVGVADRWKAEFDSSIKAITDIRPGVYKPRQAS